MSSFAALVVLCFVQVDVEVDAVAPPSVVPVRVVAEPERRLGEPPTRSGAFDDVEESVSGALSISFGGLVVCPVRLPRSGPAVVLAPSGAALLDSRFSLPNFGGAGDVAAGPRYRGQTIETQDVFLRDGQLHFETIRVERGVLSQVCLVVSEASCAFSADPGSDFRSGHCHPRLGRRGLGLQCCC